MSEQKVMFRRNPNIEYRNPKQMRIPNDKMTKTNHACRVRNSMFLLLDHFNFCHCFVFRVLYFEFLTENNGFRSSTK